MKHHDVITVSASITVSNHYTSTTSSETIDMQVIIGIHSVDSL